MLLQPKSVFVLDIAELPAFAFEADDLDAARRMSRSHWFLQPLDAFCRMRRAVEGDQLRLRAATDGETALYRDRADEFADAKMRFLIAHLV